MNLERTSGPPGPSLRSPDSELGSDSVEAVLAPELVSALEAAGALDAVLLALWRVVLTRHGWDEELMLAVGLGGRARSRDGELVREALAARVEGDPSFAALVSQTVGWMAAERETASPPAGELYTFDFAVPLFLRVRPPTLGLSCAPRGGALALELSFDAQRFETGEIRRVLARFETLARSAAAAPQTPVRQLDLLPEAERRQLLVEFNDTAAASPPEVCIQHLIAARARRAPEAPAVLAEGCELSYAELESRAEQLAERLRGHGIGPNTFVAVHAEPSPGMIVGLLSVLKAGGAYLPLDPEYPDERLTFMLGDSAAPVLLTQAGLRPIQTPAGVRTIVLDADGRATESGSSTDSESSGEARQRGGAEAGPDDLAYLIYTSGSTGVPKGVRVDHRNLMHSTLARVSYYGGRVGRFLLLSSFAFDSSVAGLFWTLVDGGALVLPPAGAHRDPRRIGELMARHAVTHTLCLASHWRLILSGAEPAAFAGLETSIVSGEVFSNELVERHDERAPGTRLYNEYGPTEGSVWSMVFDCHDPYPGNKVPIGGPIANTQIYLLDEHMSPVPIGVAGEMYQGGAGVAQGYLNCPELTAERFVPDPFSDLDGARLYRSGDLARYLPDGNVEFLGRMDDQVKIRGYRIELGEIEAVLGRHADVREAAVLCREDKEGDRRLVAYVALEAGRNASAHELREYLARTLPAYMLPAATVFLGALPRTSIGKLAAEELPAPRRERPDVGGAYVAPRTPIEEAVASIWAEAIDLEHVGVDDDFFELGGHSVLAVRIMSSLREVLDVELPMRAFFEYPTVSGLAAELVRDPARRERIERRTEILEHVSALSDTEVEEQLARRSTR